MRQNRWHNDFFSAHLYIFFYNSNFIYDTQSTISSPFSIRCGYRHSKTQLRMICSSRNFRFATFWWPMCDKSVVKKIRLSLFSINWIGSHGYECKIDIKSTIGWAIKSILHGNFIANFKLKLKNSQTRELNFKINKKKEALQSNINFLYKQ